MNKTFKIVYNRARQGLMVANEITSSVQKKGAKTVVAIAAAALCGAAFAGSEGGGDTVSTVTYNEDTTITISTDVSSGETNCYSGIAATTGNTTDVTIVDGATLNIEGDLDTISGAESIYLISAQAGSKVTITGDVTGTIKTTDSRNIRGIHTDGGEISINGDLIANVNGGTAQTNGLVAWNGAKVTLEGDKTTLNVTSSVTTGKGSYGLDVKNSGATVNFNAKETEISVNNSEGNNTYSMGAYAHQSTTTFTGNTTIKVNGNGGETDGVVFECDSENSYETLIKFSGEETTIDVSGKGMTFGVAASGDKGGINFTGKTATITAHSSGIVAFGVFSQYGANANFTADTSVSASSDGSECYAYGVYIANGPNEESPTNRAGNASFKNLTVTATAPIAFGISNEANTTASPASAETEDGTFTAESVNLSVSGAEQAIGICAAGDLAKVTIGALGEVGVSSTSGAAYGVLSQNDATVNLGTSEDTTLSVSGVAMSIGILASGEGTVGLEGETAEIESHSSEGFAYGVLSQYGANVSSTADTNVIVSTDKGEGALGVYITNSDDSGDIAATNASFKNLSITASAPNGSAAGIYNESNKVDADESSETYGTVVAETTSLSVSAAGDAVGIGAYGNSAKVTVGALEKCEVSSTLKYAVGVLSQSGGIIELGAPNSVSVITVTSGNSTTYPATGIFVEENGSVTLNGATTINAEMALGGDGTLTVKDDLTLNGSVTSFEGTATIAGGTTTLTESTGYFGNATVVISGGTLVADSITIDSGSLTLSGGTLQTKLTQVFGSKATLKDTSFSTVDNLTLTSGTLVLTDGGTYTRDSLTALKDKTSGVTLSLVNATLAAGETAPLIHNIVQETTTVTVETNGATTATIGSGTIDGYSSGTSTTGAQTIELDKAATVTVAESIKLTLVGKTDGSSFIENATAITVANNATLNLGSVNSTEATSGSLPELTLNQNAKLNVENTTVSTTALNVAEEATGVKITIGSSESAGSLHADTVKLNSSIIFIDPAWSGTDEIADASFMSVGSVDDGDLNGTIVAGRNSALALGAGKATAIAGFNALTKNNSDLTWTESGESAITAALYIGQSIALTTSTKILVNGSLTSLSEGETAAGDVSNASVTIASKGLLMIDQSAIGSSTVFTSGTLTLSDGSYVGLVNATGENLTLTATNSTTGNSDEVTVVTDNPFVTAKLASNTIISTVNAATGLQALASTGIQAMTRRADSILAQTIADRTSVDQELAPGANLWVDVAGETYEADKLDNNASFKADMGYGAFGAEFGIGDTATAGAAIQYGKGSLRSSVSSIKNSIDSYGATIYGTMKFGESKVVADIAYVKNTNDITSSQTALNQKPDTQMYSIGVRGQHRFTAGNFQIVPSVGVRVSRLETDSMDIGSVKVKKQKQNIVQVPIALRINGVTQNAAGWAISPSFKVAYVPTFGDKEITALGADQTVIDTSPVQADFGIRAQKGNLMLNANFMAGTGNDGASSIGGKVGLKYVF